MTIQRVAIVFDNTTRPETTGVYCRRALGKLVDVEHFLPHEIEQIDPRLFDLAIQVDDGLSYAWPDKLGIPSAYWAIDTHIEFERTLRKSQGFDLVFAAQQDGAAQLRAAGVESAVWLPLACDPVLHGQHKVVKRFDIAFVGNLFPGPRTDLIKVLQGRFDDVFVGREYFEAMAEVHSASRIVFNRSLKNDVNMRVFEALCSGSLLLTNAIANNGQDTLFEDGKHLATYGDVAELLDKAVWYLQHEETREQVAAAGRAEVIAKHTYEIRMREIIRACETLRHPTVSVPAPLSATGPLPAKDVSYFEHTRPEILAMLPQKAERVLDVGCGAGALGASLKRYLDCDVWGIERDPHVVRIAEQRLDHVICGDAETIDEEIASASLDCIVCGDVLEHLRNPRRFLERARRWLVPDGQIVASLPNVRHHTVIRSLLAGNWTYEPAGLLDDDHVRFFTRREMEKLFFRAGYDVREVEVVPGPGHAEWTQDGRPQQVNVGGLTYQARDVEDAEELFAYQYLIRAVPSSGQLAPSRDANPTDFTSCWGSLCDAEPWPERRPDVDLQGVPDGWLGDGARSALRDAIPRNARLIVELGSWLGKSTRFLANHAPGASIIAIDHWEGSDEHHRQAWWPQVNGQLKTGFLSECWEQRDRILPLEMDTCDGLQRVSTAGLVPEVIYVDANHHTAAVRQDLDCCRRLFSQAILIGDDYDDPEIQQAVRAFAAENGLKVNTHGKTWRGWSIDPSALHNVAASEFGPTSIVIVTHNQIAHTRACVDSIRHVTDEPYELIFVDNASTDGTPDYLQTLSAATVISNNENRGFPAAVNQALDVATGENILLLNNDTLVTTGWLRRMLTALHSEESIGLVGPLSNNVSGGQQIAGDYSSTCELDGFAWALSRRNAGRAIATDRLVGFCLLFKRAVLDAIGGLDERFGIGNFEDDDFCRRARNAGYQAVIATDAFVHHFGGATFRASGVDFARLMNENRQKFDEKWNTAEPRSGELPRLSLCMIVRNNESTIGPALESIKPWVDEMIVVDTGSTDRTPEICREMGAKVFEFPWIDDFSAARNESLKYATGEWVFWMDSDDTIPEECGRKLRELAHGTHSENCFGYVMQVHCPSADDPDDVTVVDHVKLFRNRPDLRFEHRIHEQIIPAIRRAGGDVAFTDIYVVHSGSDKTSAGRKRKLERDYRILQLDLQERPDHPFVLFNLGMTYADDEQHEAAIQHLMRCITVSDAKESHVGKAYALLVSALTKADRRDEAWVTCQRGLEIFPADKELLFRSAMLSHDLGRLEEAVETYRKVLDEESERHFASIDLGITGYKARHNLAIVCSEMGDEEQAEVEWRKVIEERPGYRPGWSGLGETLIKRRRWCEAEELGRRLMERQHGSLRIAGWILCAKVAAARDTPGAAIDLLSAAIDESPQDTEAKHEMARMLFEEGDMLQAEPVLKSLSELSPDDASVWHNLGTVYFQSGRCGKAEVAFRESLRLRPKSPETERMLACARNQTQPSVSQRQLAGAD